MKLIAWALSWTLYWIGDLASKCIPDKEESKFGSLMYWIYNRSMGGSVRTQDWAGGINGNWPWTKPKDGA